MSYATRFLSIGGAPVVFACILFAARPSLAAIDYGDFSEIPPGDVIYMDVVEDATSVNDLEPLYDSPSVSVNTLAFNPTDNFMSSASSGLSDRTEGQLRFGLEGHSAAITTLGVVSSGDYSLSGSGSSVTVVNYGIAVASVTVKEVDGLPVSSPVILPSGSGSGSDDLSGGAKNDALWNLSLNFDVNAALADAGVAFQFGATSIDVVLSNTLGSISEASSSASIAATAITIEATTVAVPEPASLAQAFMPLLILAMRRRHDDQCFSSGNLKG